MLPPRIALWFSKRYKRIWMLLLMAAALSALCYQIGNLSFMREMESKTIDFRFRLSPQSALADTNIILIAIDDASLKYVNNMGQGWPLPREFYAVITDYLSAAGAKAIIFDMLFDEADFDRADLDAAESDNRFASAMQNSGKVILSQILAQDSTLVHPSLLPHALASLPANAKDISEWQGTGSPIPIFNESAKAVAGINLLHDKDAIVRKVPLCYALQDKIYPSLAYAAMISSQSDKSEDSIKKQKEIPLSGKSEFYLNWYGKGGANGVFHYLPFSQVLKASVDVLYGNEPDLHSDLFQGKYIIIGATAAGLMDLKSSPYTWGMPGMEIWATMLSNLLGEHYIRFLNPFSNALILFLVSFLVILFVSRIKSAYSLPMVLLLFVLLIGIAFLLFAEWRISIDLSTSLLVLIISWVSILTLSYVMEGKHKKELRQMFNRYLHPDLVDRIVENPELVQMGGEELHCTVMFSDIYNFTGFSEKQSPQELVSYLNEYFSTFTNSILDHNGLLDKYTGDGLMAVFGAPISRDDHALLACLSALAHRDYSLKFAGQADLSPAQAFHLNTRLGLHSGILVAGNIGSERRMEYTSIGDTVNLAARLEGVNKIYQTHIIISESTYAMVKDRLLCRELDYLRVKGKKEPTRIYELLADKENATTDEYVWIDTYARALQLYRDGAWQEAMNIFQQLCESPLGDKASLTMAKRCAYLLQNPPQHWDGILTLEEK